MMFCRRRDFRSEDLDNLGSNIGRQDSLDGNICHRGSHGFGRDLEHCGRDLGRIFGCYMVVKGSSRQTWGSCQLKGAQRWSRLRAIAPGTVVGAAEQAGQAKPTHCALVLVYQGLAKGRVVKGGRPKAGVGS